MNAVRSSSLTRRASACSLVCLLYEGVARSSSVNVERTDLLTLPKIAVQHALSSR